MRSISARNVGACFENPRLTLETWPQWYKPDSYLVGNADLSL